MKFLILVFLFCITFSCREKAGAGSPDRDYSNSVTSSEPARKPGSKADDPSLFGPWTSGLSDNALFDIGKDSIFYVEDLESYKYVLTGDSIKIYYPDYIFSGKINLRQDTLTITTEGEESRYWRFRN